MLSKGFTAMLCACVLVSLRPIAGTACTSLCLFVSNMTDILSVKQGIFTPPKPVIRNQKNAYAIDIHFAKQWIFWIELGTKTIKRANFDGTNIKVVHRLIGFSFGIAVDWTTNNLYWTDIKIKTIEVSSLDGSNRRRLVTSKLNKPGGIALDPKAGLMFWTDWGTTPKIERASLDGNDRKELVTSSIVWPYDVTLDYSRKYIYWTDEKFKNIQRVDYNGHSRATVFHSEWLRPNYIDLMGSWLFWTDWGSFTGLHQVDSRTGRVHTRYVIQGKKRGGIAAVDSSRQPTWRSPCTNYNGGCSHLCLNKPGGLTCACPRGLSLKDDGKTCNKDIKNFLLFTDIGYKTTNIISLDVNYTAWDFVYNHGNNSNPKDLGFDPIDKRIYYIDSRRNIIGSVLINGTSDMIVYRNAGNPSGIAVDWKGKNVYWTVSDRKTIEVGSMDGKTKRILVRGGIHLPRGIALDEARGIMFWSDYGNTSKIERANMDGSARRTIVHLSVKLPTGLALDTSRQKLYWADAFLDTIEECTYLGANRRVIARFPSKYFIFGLAFAGKMLYMTEWEEKQVLSVNVSTGRIERIAAGLLRPMGIHAYHSVNLSGDIKCAALKHPANGQVTPSSCLAPSSVSSVCSLTCNNGFQLTGTRTRTCTLSKTWTGSDDTRCEAIKCAALKHPANGGLTPSSCLAPTSVSSVCRLTCNSGFQLTGTRTRKCTLSKTWTGSDDTRCEVLFPVNCSAGYFKSTQASKCSLCPVDHYQANADQFKCTPCPKGTSTRGQTGAKTRQACQTGTAEKKKAGSSSGKREVDPMLIGIGVGVVAMVIICTAGALCWNRRRKRRIIRKAESRRAFALESQLANRPVQESAPKHQNGLSSMPNGFHETEFNSAPNYIEPGYEDVNQFTKEATAPPLPSDDYQNRQGGSPGYRQLCFETPKYESPYGCLDPSSKETDMGRVCTNEGCAIPEYEDVIA